MRACAQKNRQHKTPNCQTRNMARLSEHGIRLSSVRIYLFPLCLFFFLTDVWHKTSATFLFFFFTSPITFFLSSLKMSPSFLNSNSTSHTWPFSAVAELTGEKQNNDSGGGFHTEVVRIRCHGVAPESLFGAVAPAKWSKLSTRMLAKNSSDLLKEPTESPSLWFPPLRYHTFCASEIRSLKRGWMGGFSTDSSAVLHVTPSAVFPVVNIGVPPLCSL